MVSELRKKRFLAGLTLYDVWRDCGIDPPRLSLLERGYKKPRPDEVEKLARTLNCDPKDIFPPEAWQIA